MNDANRLDTYGNLTGEILFIFKILTRSVFQQLWAAHIFTCEAENAGYLSSTNYEKPWLNLLFPTARVALHLS